MDMGELSKQLMILNKDFNTKRYGYAKFSKMILDFPSVKISTSHNGKNKVVRIAE